nr:immunoglobulin heavy chain junction region [Macaca mulatta]
CVRGMNTVMMDVW